MISDQRHTTPPARLLSPVSGLRLLPWSTPEGKPCYLSTDGNGLLSRLADDVEAAQLASGAHVLSCVQALLKDPRAGAGEMRWSLARVAECLRDALRVAESRGARLPDPGPDAEGEHSRMEGEAEDAAQHCASPLPVGEEGR